MKEAVEYIEGLPDYRKAAIHISFQRLEDRRRGAVTKNRHIEYRAYTLCHYSEEEIKIHESMGYGAQYFFMYQVMDICYDRAIKLALDGLKSFIADPKKVIIDETRL